MCVISPYRLHTHVDYNTILGPFVSVTLHISTTYKHVCIQYILKRIHVDKGACISLFFLHHFHET